MDKMLMRKSKDGRLLLLACPSPTLKGRLALGRVPCDFKNWHIAVRTQNFQHPSCIDLHLEGRTYREYTATDTTRFSKCYIIFPDGPGTFTVGLRWTRGHSPYPRIITMEAWILGCYFGTRDYPKAPSDYLQLATVEVQSTGQCFVNGKNAGFWPELLE